MKKSVKILTLVLAVCLLTMSLAACGSQPANDAAKTQTAAGSAFTMDTLKIGTNAEFPPFEFVDSELGVINEYAGIDIEIAKGIADSISAKPVINNIDFDGLLLALSNGQIDMVIAGMTLTEERAKQVDFSEPYYVASQVLIVKEDSPIASAKDLKDKKIGVIDGYTGQTCVEDMGYDFSGYKKGSDAVLDVVNGKLDVLVIDSATAEKYIKQNKGLKIVKDTSAFEEEKYAIAVKKGNKQLLDAINAYVKTLTSEKISELSAKYN